MTDISPRLEGEKWQVWADLLLKRHYGPGEYQTIPDSDRGDAGIEGFTIKSGHAYQAYGPEGGPLSVFDRNEKYRIKMTNDIKKFIDNKEKLLKLFGDVKITRWILFVPKFDSKEIVTHATKKTEYVLSQNLPYVAPDFRICIESEETFAVERDQLLNSHLSEIVIEVDPINEINITDWIDQNDKLIKTVDDKLTRLKTLNSDPERVLYRNKLIIALLKGQNTINELRLYPTAHDNISKIKNEKEEYLSLETMSAVDTKGILVKCFDDMNKLIMETPGISRTLSSAISWEAIADWLFRCPLDFPE